MANHFAKRREGSCLAGNDRLLSIDRISPVSGYKPILISRVVTASGILAPRSQGIMVRSIMATLREIIIQ